MARAKIILLLLTAIFLAASTIRAYDAGDYYSYGMKLYSAGIYEKAVPYFMKAVDLDPANQVYYKMAGMCYQETGNTGYADRMFAAADKLGEAPKPDPQVLKDRFVFGVFGGYTNITMQYINDRFFRSPVQSALMNSPDAKTTLSTLGNAFSGGIRAGYLLTPEWSAGLKIQYIDAAQGEMSYSYTDMFMGDFYSEETKMAAWLLPIEAYASYEYTFKNINIAISAEVSGGMGIAGVDISDAYNDDFSDTGDARITLSSFKPVFSVSIKGTWYITPAINLDIEAGYRSALFTEMYVDSISDSEYYGTTVKGMALRDNNGNSVPFDFSGIILDIGLNYKL